MTMNVPTWFHENLESIVRIVRRRGTAGLRKNRFSNILVRGSDEGSPVAKFLLGVLYEYLALKDVGIERGDGVTYILQSAILGYQDAVNWCYEHILAYLLDGEQEYRAHIIEMCEVGAKAGDARVQLMYALILMDGYITPRNKAMSDFWLKQAIDQGFDAEKWMSSIQRERR